MMRWLQATVVIVVTVFIALALTVAPIPNWAAALWPPWVALVVFYWAIALPEFFGVLIAWVVGLLMDALTGTPLGAHALALTLVAFVAARAPLKLQGSLLWQQSVTLGFALVLYAFALFWIGGLTGALTRPLAQFMPVLIGAALWPWVFPVMRGIRRLIVVTA
ncbi:MAG: rod shape-determining protein MreD [Gammaproteobacteria bacterium]